MTLLRGAAGRVRTLPLRRARTPQDIGLVGLLAVRNEMRYLPGWFAANAEHLDGVIAYDDGSDDGSAEYLAARPEVRRLLRRDPAAAPGWDEPAVRRALVAAAGAHGADWLVAVDADERLECDFGVRARRAISRLERRGITAAAVQVPELWDAPDRVRVDGVWRERWRARLFRWRPDAVWDGRRFHGHWAPLDATVNGGFVQTDMRMYHLRMIQRSDRLARYERYQSLDPDRVWQPAGYEYLIDEQGVVTEPVEPGRDYRPRHEDPRLAVVVMSVGDPPSLRAAIDSLLNQVPRPEICVVNSGGGDVRGWAAPLGCRVVERADTLTPGATRNLGVRATTAPFVAFLAADCFAEPGWVAARLEAHVLGAAAVASAVVPHVRSPIASAAGLRAFGGRHPAIPHSRAAHYGASYARSVIARVGGFREDLRTGEDTDLHARLAEPIVWRPQVRTRHLSPLTAHALWADQRDRGAHAARAWAQLRGRGRVWFVLTDLRGFLATLHAIRTALTATQRRDLRRTAPWLIVASIARATGALRSTPAAGHASAASWPIGSRSAQRASGPVRRRRRVVAVHRADPSGCADGRERIRTGRPDDG